MSGSRSHFQMSKTCCASVGLMSATRASGCGSIGSGLASRTRSGNPGPKRCARAGNGSGASTTEMLGSGGPALVQKSAGKLTHFPDHFHQITSVLSIASAATVLSHVNDSGFWFVSRYLGLSEAQTLRSWTLTVTLVGLVGLAMTLVLSLFV